MGVLRELRQGEREEVLVGVVVAADDRGDRVFGDRRIRRVRQVGVGGEVLSGVVGIEVVDRPERDPALHRDQLVEDDPLLGHVAEEPIVRGLEWALLRGLLEDRFVEGRGDLVGPRDLGGKLVGELREILLIGTFGVGIGDARLLQFGGETVGSPIVFPHREESAHLGNRVGGDIGVGRVVPYLSVGAEVVPVILPLVGIDVVGADLARRRAEIATAAERRVSGVLFAAVEELDLGLYI